MDDKTLSRRSLIAGAAAAAGGAIVASLPLDAQQTAKAAPPVPPVVPEDPSKMPGSATPEVGSRSPFFNPKRSPAGEITGSSRTPLQDLTGTITPSDLHFTRIHA